MNVMIIEFVTTCKAIKFVSVNLLDVDYSRDKLSETIANYNNIS